ncbi:hypothetical protein LDC_0846 [sediment metagenome]|uniref:Uncharacterized protein n=1 Tax=sediment metagenome TaxID=749907 RepID=D9PH47_9ZZZZ
MPRSEVEMYIPFFENTFVYSEEKILCEIWPSKEGMMFNFNDLTKEVQNEIITSLQETKKESQEDPRYRTISTLEILSVEISAIFPDSREFIYERLLLAHRDREN